MSSQLFTPAEVHGLLSGIICANFRALSADTLLEVGFFSFAEEGLSDKQVKLLSTLYEVTKEKITNMEFDFQLFLPPDDVSLLERAKALGEWCQGFMSGFGLAGGQLNEKEHFDAVDALKKISEAAQVDYQHLTISEADEAAFMEVVEYIRMAVLVIFSDLNSKTDHDNGAGGSKKYH